MSGCNSQLQGGTRSHGTNARCYTNDAGKVQAITGQVGQDATWKITGPKQWPMNCRKRKISWNYVIVDFVPSFFTKHVAVL